MQILTGFIGKNRDFRAWLAAQLQPGRVIYLQRCELCGRMAADIICRRCEPVFARWIRRIRAELKKENRRSGHHHDPSIA